MSSETITLKKALSKGKIHICTRHGQCKDILYDNDLGGIFIHDEEQGVIFSLANISKEKWRKRDYAIEEIRL